MTKYHTSPARPKKNLRPQSGKIYDQKKIGNIKVPIEVKGTWHAKVIESVGTQLHDRYMLDSRCGIHVTAFFTCDSWTDEDNRKSRGVSRVALGEVLRRLQAERDQVMATSGKRIEVLLLDARL